LVRQITTWIIKRSYCTNYSRPGLGQDRNLYFTAPTQRYNLLQQIKDTLSLSKVLSHILELEITEGVVMNSRDYINETIAQLNSLGITIAMGDFGT
jgi:EAL domain-containing protein (putative c-di-GMP-specific phosphodiesterase class I)